jgi:Na+-transporting methylmalonyl-CoA/oxaloacetate decarboxylase gamma subunit
VEPAFAFDAEHVIAFHEACLDSGKWPDEEAPAHPPGNIWPWVEANHACNARLWREEDLARRGDAADAEIAAGKRAIDKHNQQRNDAVERLDEAIHGALAQDMRADARLNSETPGMMIDRLSILALRIRAMGAQARRDEAGADHVRRCAQTLEKLEEQRRDLAGCLAALLAACAAGAARFKVYRPFKMYNDPALNPQIYRR